MIDERNVEIYLRFFGNLAGCSEVGLKAGNLRAGIEVLAAGFAGGGLAEAGVQLGKFLVVDSVGMGFGELG